MFGLARILFKFRYPVENDYYKMFILDFEKKARESGWRDILYIDYAGINTDLATTKLAEFYLNAFTYNNNDRKLLERDYSIHCLFYLLQTAGVNGVKTFLHKIKKENVSAFEWLTKLVGDYIASGKPQRDFKADAIKDWKNCLLI